MYELAAAMLTVSDLPRSVRFYTETLGFFPGRSFPDRWTELVSVCFSVFLVERRPGEAVEHHGSTGLTLVVKDLEHRKRFLEKRGAAFIGDIVDAETLRLAILEDPDGHPIYLVEARDDHPTIPIPLAALRTAGVEA